MSDQVEFEIHLHSPRWGTINIYEFHLDQKLMRIGKKAELNPIICTWNHGEKPIWSRAQVRLMDRNPLELLLEEDLIFPPNIFVRSLEVAWRSWKISVLDDEEIQFQIGLLCEWVNLVSATRPTTDFWRRVF